MAVIELTEDNFRSQVLESQRPVVVDFYADWCGPCKQVSPIVEQLSDKWAAEVGFAKVDIEAQPEIARAYRISSIPAILRFEDGEVTGWCIGSKPGYVIERELRLTKRGVGDRKGLLSRLLGRD